MAVSLRPLADSDLDQLFEWEKHPDAVAMAAFTRADPSDREAFDAHHARVRANPDNRMMAIEVDDQFVGTIGSFTMNDERCVAYWIDPALWGRGIATHALRAFLDQETTRPLFAYVAEHNVGSEKVLARAGFERIGEETAFAPGIGRETVEHIFRRDH